MLAKVARPCSIAATMVEKSSVVLRLEDPRGLVADGRYALDELADGLFLGDRLEAEDGRGVADRREGRRRGSRDALRGRVEGRELGMCLLEPAELRHQPVVLGIGDRGAVEDVVARVVGPDLIAELGNPAAGQGIRQSRMGASAHLEQPCCERRTNLARGLQSVIA
jgi:hypothetical protein